MSFYYEEIEVGDVLELGEFEFTAELIKSYSEIYDPLPFHLDEEAAKNGPFGALAASGWQVSAIWMHCMCRTLEQLAKDRIACNEPVAKMGPSPGFKNMRWLKPVLAGDVISYECEITNKRTTANRPEWGILFIHNRAKNPQGELVMEFDGIVFVERNIVLMEDE